MESRIRLNLEVAVFLAMIGGMARAGDLNPPAGPVAPTHKTLTEVEPRIAINATNTPGDADSVFRIALSGSYYLTSNVFGAAGKSGIEIGVDNVTIDLAGFSLIGAPGALDGISAPGRSDIAIRNGNVRSWPGDGIGLSSASQTVVEEVVARSNTGIGINTFSRSLVKDCICYANGGAGIVVGSVSTMTLCLCYNNGGPGISTGGTSTITQCVTRLNQAQGILAVGPATISGCTSATNTTHGIEVSSTCFVSGNECSNAGNGGTGANILATGGDNRIEGNNVTGGDFGIQVTGTGNLIVRNSSSGAGTANYSIAASNKDAQVLSPGSGFVSTDPWANFTY